MPHPRQISAELLLATALHLLETEGPAALSLRAVAARMGVRAPSLYHYFPDKAALEAALIEHGSARLYAHIAATLAARPDLAADPRLALRTLANAYCHFARTRPNLYTFLMQQAPGSGHSPSGKDLWNLLLASLAAITGIPDDTPRAVALWSFLHGFVALELAGRFGPSGPHGAFELGLAPFLQPPAQLR